MIARAFILWLALCSAAVGQVGQMPNPTQLMPFTSATYVGPVDIVASPKALFSLRCSSTSYTGNVVDVWDSATGSTTETLVTCSSGGVLNETINALSVTCAVACKVKTLYDQSGASGCTATACDLTQATNANRPVFTLNCINSKPCVAFGTNQSLVSANAFTSINQPYTMSGVANRTANFTTPLSILTNSAGGNGQLLFRQLANSVQMFAGTGGVFISNITDVNFHTFQGVFNAASSDLMCGGSAGTACSVAGTSNSLNPGNGAFANSTLIIGSGASVNGQQVTEAMIYPIGFSGTQETNMTANQYGYWGPF